jgi:hypothetical protein
MSNPEPGLNYYGDGECGDGPRLPPQGQPTTEMDSYTSKWQIQPPSWESIGRLLMDDLQGGHTAFALGVVPMMIEKLAALQQYANEDGRVSVNKPTALRDSEPQAPQGDDHDQRREMWAAEIAAAGPIHSTFMQAAAERWGQGSELARDAAAEQASP